jgi:hypothetical protein
LTGPFPPPSPGLVAIAAVINALALAIASDKASPRASSATMAAE